MTRNERWMQWIKGVRSTLLEMPDSSIGSEARGFFKWHYSTHTPGVFDAPQSDSLVWSPEELGERIGDKLVEVQTGRLSNPNYEPQSNTHKTLMPFNEFIHRMMEAPGNDLYMTANNTEASAHVIHALAPDLAPLPPMLQPRPDLAMLWIGKDSKTPLHHDLTQNLLIQHYGEKVVTLFAPGDQPLLANSHHVYSDHRWLDAEDIVRLGMNPVTINLTPGTALFIPVGWFHQVESIGPAIMTSYTCFPWPNYWREGFPS